MLCANNTISKAELEKTYAEKLVKEIVIKAICRCSEIKWFAYMEN